MEKWHLYMDECGLFEKSGPKHPGWKSPLILAMLVPEESSKVLGVKYTQLCRKAGFGDIAHGRDLHQQPAYPDFSARLVQETIDNKLPLFVIRHSEDIYRQVPPQLQESFADNRYRSMAEALLEHILFLHPPYWTEELSLDFHPNTRVIPIQKDQVKDYRDCGYSCFNPKGSDIYLAHVWRDEALRIFLHRLGLEFAPWHSMIQERTWEQVEMIQADKSNDPFVHWVDNLAGILMWSGRGQKESADKLSRHLTADLEYGFSQKRFKDIVLAYLNQDIHNFLPLALEERIRLSKPYYSRQVDNLVEQGLLSLLSQDIQSLLALEQEIDAYLRSSMGNWAFVRELTEKLLENLRKLPADQLETRRVQNLLFALYNHKLSLHNHRGEALPAWQIVQKVESSHFKPENIDDWRSEVSFYNRQAVARANVFDFEQGHEDLLPLLQTLEQNLKKVQKISKNSSLKDNLIGRLQGTIGQNYAFLAPHQPEYFDKSEKMFKKAKSEFIKSGDLLRQETYLLHLYLDGLRTGQYSKRKITNQYNALGSYEPVHEFLKSPGPETSRYMQYVLHLIVKLAFEYGEMYEKTLQIYPLKELKDWFGQAVNEHPFELICGYLGRMALAQGKKKHAHDYFEQALSIPNKDNAREQVTLQAIRGEILTWWAIGLEQIGDKAQAGEKMKQALSLLDELGSNPALITMLQLQDGKAVGGWFKEAYNVLSQVDWDSNFDNSACEAFLDCFTFNYR